MIIKAAAVLFLLTPFFAFSEPDMSKTSTAQANVKVLAEQLSMASLNKSRTIRIYLPPGYEDTEERYPVLYMHDGQNLFDDRTSYAGEWGVDEALNRLAEEQGLHLIVVGIDNGGEKRMNELSPWPHQDFIPAQGEQYAAFIVETLKPYIDSRYRTLQDAEHTAVMGSSMGGLMSHYLIYQYPEVFSKAGIFSPSYWFSEQVYSSAGNEMPSDDARLYFLVGGQEPEVMVDGMQRMVDQISADKDSAHRLLAVVDPDGTHTETFWRKHFEAAVAWLFESAE